MNTRTSIRAVDAHQCICCFTSAEEGHIEIELRKALGTRIYGCNECNTSYSHEALTTHTLADLVALDEITFQTLFNNSPIQNIGHARFIRNTLIAIGNSNDSTLIPHILPLLTEPSPFVRSAAVWALTQLASDREYSIIWDDHVAYEQDKNVLTEWKRKKHSI